MLTIKVVAKLAELIEATVYNLVQEWSRLNEPSGNTGGFPDERDMIIKPQTSYLCREAEHLNENGDLFCYKGGEIEGAARTVFHLRNDHPHPVAGTR